MTLKKGSKCIMLISTLSSSWDTEAREITAALAEQGIEVINVIEINRFNGVDFIEILEK